MENPEAVRGAFERIISDKMDNIQQYKNAIAQLISLVEKKKSSLKGLTEDVEKLEKLKTGAIQKAKATAAELQQQGVADEEIKQNAEYVKCVTAYQDFNSTLEEKNARITELEVDIEDSQDKIDAHKNQMKQIHRDLEKIKEEQSETVGDLIIAKQQEEIADLMSGISTDGTSEELSRMREIREKAKGRSVVAQELAGTDARSEEAEFLAAAQSTAASDEFDSLIFGAQQSDAPVATDDTAEKKESDSELPL
ncbi:hypothetical protein F4083_02380 [Candidatus Poribacteria bacterium]|nr:hypothetical protein [Candidatus Poribacteria bacterium]